MPRSRRLGPRLLCDTEYSPLPKYVSLGHAWDMRNSASGGIRSRSKVNLYSCHVSDFGPEYRYVWIRVDRNLAFDHAATCERMHGWAQHQRHHLRMQMAPKRLARLYWRPP
jgi:hypothetical protein